MPIQISPHLYPLIRRFFKSDITSSPESEMELVVFLMATSCLVLNTTSMLLIRRFIFSRPAGTRTVGLIITFSFLPLSVLQVVADINALSLLHLQIMMTLFLSGLILKALLGPLPFALIVFLIECERGAILIAIGWYNASALLQFFIIHNQR